MKKSTANRLWRCARTNSRHVISRRLPAGPRPAGLAGLKLVGFAVWERRDGLGHNVTFPARQFIVHGDRRNFALLRAVGNGSGL